MKFPKKGRERDSTSTNADVELKRLLKEIEEIRSSIQNLKDDIKSMQLLCDKMLINPVSSAEIQQSLDETSTKVRKIIFQLGARTKELTKRFEAGNPTLKKILHFHHSSLLRDFTTVGNECMTIQAEYRDKRKEQFQSQVEISGYANGLIEKNNFDVDDPGLSVFTGNLMLESRQALNSLKAVKERHDEILKIEKSIVEIHGLFRELAFITETQGYAIDTIENNIVGTDSNIKQGSESLKKAGRSKRKNRKTKLVLASVATVVSTVVLVILTL